MTTSTIHEQSLSTPFSFSRVWEDYSLLLRALDIQPEKDTVLCITGAGDNILNLLLEKPKKIVAVDINPAESALLEFKMAAIKLLGYEDYLIVLGDKEDTEQKRESLYEEIKECMPKYAQKYFSNEMVKDGISTSGWAQEKLLRHLSESVSNLVNEKDLDYFFVASSMEEQKESFQKFSSGLEEAVLSNLSKKKWSSIGFKEKHFSDLETIYGDVSQYFLSNFRRACLTLPARDNYYLSLLLRGTRGFVPDVNPELAPPFLQEKNFHKLKQLVDRVEVVSSKVEEYIAEPGTPSCDKVYLSNIFDGLDLDVTQSILQVVVDNMPSGGILAYHTIFEPNKPPSTETLKKLTYFEDLSVELQKEDRMPMYCGFHVYSVGSA